VFEHFTPQARRVIVVAQDEARAFGHTHLGTEHILLGLLGKEAGLAAQVLEGFRLTTQEVRALVIRMVHPGKKTSTNQLLVTPGATKVLERAFQEALSLGHQHIGTEHILLGLVGEPEGESAGILRELGVHPAAVRSEVMHLLSSHTVPSDRQDRTCS
jgi:ATP-dependent Clp protease ATP-binding subunit ClpC